MGRTSRTNRGYLLKLRYDREKHVCVRVRVLWEMAWCTEVLKMAHRVQTLTDTAPSDVTHIQKQP